MFTILNKLLNNLNNQKLLLLIIILTILILMGMFFLNDIVLSIRMLELQAFLREINREASEVDELGMVSKYKLHFELYMDSIDEKKLDEEELKIVYLATSFEVQSRISNTKYKDASQPVIWIINLLRAILRKPPIQVSVNNQTDTELTLAYYFERNKHYQKALQIYEDALKSGKVAENKIPVVLLHEGFCYSIIGEYDKAKTIFLSIIKSWENENVAVTAALMLQYLENLLSEIAKVKASGASVVRKSEQLYRLIAYKDAITILDTIDTGNTEEVQKINYLKARCYEETGKKEESVQLYQEIIQNDHASDMAELANRRILVIASVDDDAEKLRDLAKKNNEIIQDTGFGQLLEKSDKVKEQRVLLDNDIKKSISTEIKAEAEAQALLTETNREDTVPDKEKMDEFIDSALNVMDEKIKQQTERMDITPEHTLTAEPAITPTLQPTVVPALRPTAVPTLQPTVVPALRPTAVPTLQPTAVPTLRPTAASTLKPGEPYVIPYNDNKGNVYKLEHYDARGNLENTIIYEYDAKGNPVAIKVYDKNGNIIED